LIIENKVVHSIDGTSVRSLNKLPIKNFFCVFILLFKFV